MDRLRPLKSLATRTWVICTVFAVILLWSGGGSFLDAFRLVTGVLSVGSDGEGVLRFLLWRAFATFILISLALIFGVSGALAVAVLSSFAGSSFSKVMGWLGRAVSGVPPMAWALLSIALLIQRWHLPVETLFPYEPRAGTDSFGLWLGRLLWAWLVPMIVLALPVFGMALHTLCHRFGFLWKGTLIRPLRARGLSRSAIIFGHLLPEVQIHVTRLVKPCVPMLLAYSIPVEEILRFDGWGEFAATALRTHSAPQVSAMIYLAGAMLAAWYGLVGMAEKHQRRWASSWVEPEDPEQARSWICTGFGVALLLALAFLPWSSSALSFIQMSDWQQAYDRTFNEISHAFWVAFAATALIFLSAPLMALVYQKAWSPRPAILATFARAPLLVGALGFAAIFPEAKFLGTVAVVLALGYPGLIAFRGAFLIWQTRTFVDAARAMGSRRLDIWRRHILPLMIPMMLNGLLRLMAVSLVWQSFLSFYALKLGGAPQGTSSWGGQMLAHSELVLDTIFPVLAPAVLLALWSLSFRLLSRAFRVEISQPQPLPSDGIPFSPPHSAA